VQIRKGMKNNAINNKAYEKVIEEKNVPLKSNLDITNKNLKTVIIRKAKKMNEFENIKSEYILKDIFSFLSEKKKLEIIIYNKHLQKNLNINIENYKRIKGIYREGERNGKRKEYNISTKHIAFKGEYLNGEINGKGKNINIVN